MNHVVYAVLAPITLSLAFAAIQDPVHLQTGSVSGEAGKDPAVHVYKGIPYAAPPLCVLVASGAPNSRITMHVTGIAILSIRSTLSSFTSAPDRSIDVMKRPSS